MAGTELAWGGRDHELLLAGDCGDDAVIVDENGDG